MNTNPRLYKGRSGDGNDCSLDRFIYNPGYYDAVFFVVFILNTTDCYRQDIIQQSSNSSDKLRRLQSIDVDSAFMEMPPCHLV